MKYSWKGFKDRNRHKNGIKRNGQARLGYVKNINHHIPTTSRWARGDSGIVKKTNLYNALPVIAVLIRQCLIKIRTKTNMVLECWQAVGSPVGKTAKRWRECASRTFIGCLVTRVVPLSRCSDEEWATVAQRSTTRKRSKRTLFNWKKKQDKTCKFSRKSSFSSYVQHKKRKTDN